MGKAYFITAIGTPLTDDEQLHEEGLRAELSDQWAHGMSGVLIAGSMGAMQLLTNETYCDLIRQGVELSHGKGEVMVGAGDAGFARSRDRIRFINDYANKIDGIAVLAPYFWGFSQAELVDYFKALADESKAPLYLYDLPQVTGTKLEMDTILELAKHPNIAGAKVSCIFNFTRRLIDLAPEGFRIIPAQVEIMDMLLKSDINTILDGMWAIAPAWTMKVSEAAEKGDWDTAAEFTRQVTNTRELLMQYGSNAFTYLMNTRGIPGWFMPKPFARFDAEKIERLLNEPIAKQLIEEDPAAK